MPNPYYADPTLVELASPVIIQQPLDADPQAAATYNTNCFEKLNDVAELYRKILTNHVRCDWGGFVGSVGANDAYAGDFHLNWSGATAPAFGGPSASYNGPYCRMVTPANGNTFYASAGEAAGLLVYASWLYARFDAYIGFEAAGANNINVNVGISNLPFNANFKGAHFRKNSAENNWKCVTNDGAASTVTDSGVAASTSGMHHLRMEIFGSGFSGGPKVDFYVDGTKVTHTANVYTSAASALSANVTSTAVVGNANALKVGRLLCSWNLVNGS